MKNNDSKDNMGQSQSFTNSTMSNSEIYQGRDIHINKNVVNNAPLLKAFEAFWQNLQNRRTPKAFPFDPILFESIKNDIEQDEYNPPEAILKHLGTAKPSELTATITTRLGNVSINDVEGFFHGYNVIHGLCQLAFAAALEYGVEGARQFLQRLSLPRPQKEIISDNLAEATTLIEQDESGKTMISIYRHRLTVSDKKYWAWNEGVITGADTFTAYLDTWEAYKQGSIR